MNVEFKFKVKEKVKTLFGDFGYVSIASINEDNSIQYWVLRSTESQWFREDQLESIEL